MASYKPEVEEEGDDGGMAEFQEQLAENPRALEVSRKRKTPDQNSNFSQTQLILPDWIGEKKKVDKEQLVNSQQIAHDQKIADAMKLANEKKAAAQHRQFQVQEQKVKLDKAVKQATGLSDQEINAGMTIAQKSAGWYVEEHDNPLYDGYLPKRVNVLMRPKPPLPRYLDVSNQETHPKQMVKAKIDVVAKAAVGKKSDICPFSSFSSTSSSTTTPERDCCDAIGLVHSIFPPYQSTTDLKYKGNLPSHLVTFLLSIECEKRENWCSENQDIYEAYLTWWGKQNPLPPRLRAPELLEALSGYFQKLFTTGRAINRIDTHHDVLTNFYSPEVKRWFSRKQKKGVVPSSPEQVPTIPHQEVLQVWKSAELFIVTTFPTYDQKYGLPLYLVPFLLDKQCRRMTNCVTPACEIWELYYEWYLQNSPTPQRIVPIDEVTFFMDLSTYFQRSWNDKGNVKKSTNKKFDNFFCPTLNSMDME